MIVYVLWEYEGDGVVISGRSFRGVYGSERLAQAKIDADDKCMHGPQEIVPYDMEVER